MRQIPVSNCSPPNTVSLRRLPLVPSSYFGPLFLYQKKRHWNSFSTGFFVTADDVDRWLAEMVAAGEANHADADSPVGAVLSSGGTLSEWHLPSEDELEALLSLPMKCQRCGKESLTVPAAKQHSASCTM